MYNFKSRLKRRGSWYSSVQNADKTKALEGQISCIMLFCADVKCTTWPLGLPGPASDCEFMNICAQ